MEVSLFDAAAPAAPALRPDDRDGMVAAALHFAELHNSEEVDGNGFGNSDVAYARQLVRAVTAVQHDRSAEAALAHLIGVKYRRLATSFLRLDTLIRLEQFSVQDTDARTLRDRMRETVFISHLDAGRYAVDQQNGTIFYEARESLALKRDRDFTGAARFIGDAAAVANYVRLVEAARGTRGWRATA